MLMDSTGVDLSALLLAASTLREQGKGQRISYSPKVFIPLTNMCRDRCGYCTFVKSPTQIDAHLMTPEEVLDVAQRGSDNGCKEALFSLGDHPEWRHSEAMEQLKNLGYRSTPEYLAAMCRLVLEQTGLLPHSNCGVLDIDELRMLREVNVSMGLMLENVSERLLNRGGPHFGADSKRPSLRLETLCLSGEMDLAMTTGILIGIGESHQERVDSLIAIREVHRKYENIQEVIIQNFRAKKDTRMRGYTEPTTLDMVRTLAVSRLLLGPEMNIQAPPNLNIDACQIYLLAGINDWGGVSPLTKDFINPEKPWPQLKWLRDLTEEAGLQLTERLALYPEYVLDPSGRWLSLAVRKNLDKLCGVDGFVRTEIEAV